jgi:leukotriene-A4 hydrolase
VVPYEKGFCLLKYLENLIGKENFQIIFRDYIIRFTNQSITYKDYINVFEENVKKIYGDQSKEILKKIDWNKSIFSKGDLTEKVEFSNN